MKRFIGICMLLLGYSAAAQNTLDFIQLKNGAFYRGKITEHIPKDHTVIQLLDGRIVTFQAEDMAGISSEADFGIKQNFEIKSRGYYHHSLLGPQFGRDIFGVSQPYFAYNMVNGYKLKNHHLGVGLDYESHAGGYYSPLYLDYAYQLSDFKVKPMVGINGGMMLPLNLAQTNFERRHHYQKGSFIGARIGFMAYANAHVAFLLNMTYRYIQLKDAEYDRIGFFPMHMANGSAELHRIGVMVGIAIN